MQSTLRRPPCVLWRLDELLWLECCCMFHSHCQLNMRAMQAPPHPLWLECCCMFHLHCQLNRGAMQAPPPPPLHFASRTWGIAERLCSWFVIYWGWLHYSACTFVGGSYVSERRTAAGAWISSYFFCFFNDLLPRGLRFLGFFLCVIFWLILLWVGEGLFFASAEITQYYCITLTSAVCAYIDFHFIVTSDLFSKYFCEVYMCRDRKRVLVWSILLWLDALALGANVWIPSVRKFLNGCHDTWFSLTVSGTS